MSFVTQSGVPHGFLRLRLSLATLPKVAAIRRLNPMTFALHSPVRLQLRAPVHNPGYYLKNAAHDPFLSHEPVGEPSTYCLFPPLRGALRNHCPAPDLHSRRYCARRDFCRTSSFRFVRARSDRLRHDTGRKSSDWLYLDRNRGAWRWGSRRWRNRSCWRDRDRV
jgi:hypothetical protein